MAQAAAGDRAGFALVDLTRAPHAAECNLELLLVSGERLRISTPCYKRLSLISMRISRKAIIDFI